MPLNHINLLIAIILVLIDILLMKHIGKKALFFTIPSLKINKLIAFIIFLLLIYAIINNEFLFFIICITSLRIIDKIIFIVKNSLYLF